MHLPRTAARQICLLAASVTLLAVGCASSPPPAGDALSPDRLKNGPSMYETGRFAAVPLSSSGLTVDEGNIDPHARRAPAPAGARVSSARGARIGHHAPKRRPHPRVDP
jgi:hypothetical protein